MNLYNFYNGPGKLMGYERAVNIVPELIYEFALNNNVITKLTPEQEKNLSKSAEYSYLYATRVLRGRFKLGEPAIAKDCYYAAEYAVVILKGPFYDAEAAIATNAEESTKYAKYALKGRFEEGEPAIEEDPYYKNDYEKFLDNIGYYDEYRRNLDREYY